MSAPSPWLQVIRPPLPPGWQAACASSRDARRSGLASPPGVPVWVFLQWLADEHGLLLHGSGSPDIERFQPRTPNDRSPDDFSKQSTVFASSDAAWTIFYAVALNSPGRNMLNAALQDRTGDGWGAMRYFFSLSYGPAFPFRDGQVYLLPRASFVQMPPYGWPGVGEVKEPQWASLEAVEPVASVRGTPHDFPLLESVRRHDNALVQAWARADPWAFPWLDG